jgi:hypothetical protein
MPNTELQPFIDAAKQRGAGDEFLAELLASRGWPPRDVYAALADWWERTTGIALPAKHSNAENARDAFLYLLAFSMLATWASALGSIWFRLIELWFPDPVVGGYPYDFRSTVTWQMACILVALPIYVFVMRAILRETGASPERIESGVRKWLTYIALLLAATGVVCDLVWFVDYFLKGEITVRFFLKCAVVLIICGSIFWYYFGFLRGRARSAIFGAATLAAASATVVLGLTTAGTPAVQRKMEADIKRVQELRSLAIGLAALPAPPRLLSEFAAARPGLRAADPETGMQYEYTVKSAKEFELCATFSRPASPHTQPYASAFWSHAAGRSCFAFETGRPVLW